MRLKDEYNKKIDENRCRIILKMEYFYRNDLINSIYLFICY